MGSWPSTGAPRLASPVSPPTGIWSLHTTPRLSVRSPPFRRCAPPAPPGRRAHPRRRRDSPPRSDARPRCCTNPSLHGRPGWTPSRGRSRNHAPTRPQTAASSTRPSTRGGRVHHPLSHRIEVATSSSHRPGRLVDVNPQAFVQPGELSDDPTVFGVGCVAIGGCGAAPSGSGRGGFQRRRRR